MKTGYLLLLSVLCGVLAGLLPVAGRAADEGVPIIKNKETAQPPPAATATVQKDVEAKPSQLSAGLDDIVKLSKAGMEESIILSFIKCAQVAYQPTAQELIKLRELGLSSTIIEALMQRGEEVRQRAAETQKPQAQFTSAHETTQPTPQVASPPEPTRVDSDTAAAYSAAATNVVYVPGYYPPYYYGYYPSYSIGFGFGYGCYPYGYYGGCYPYGYCGSYYYGDCHGGSYHVGPYGSYNGAKSGYVSGSPNASKSGGVNRGAYQAGYSGARQSSYGGGTYGGSTGGYKSGYSGGSYGGYRGGAQSAVYRGGSVGGSRGGYGGGGYRGK